MKFSLCNEVLSHLCFEQQCQWAAEMGYDGLEVAPYTLADDPTRISDNELAGYRKIAADTGMQITGLHWLLLAPKGLSIVDPSPHTRQKTMDTLKALIHMGHELGAEVLVHGSPAQRRLGDDSAGDRERARDYLAQAGGWAAQAGLIYCIEPLSPKETNFINTVAEGAELVKEIDTPGLRTMLDTSAAAQAESAPVDEVLTEWLPTGYLAHLQLNDRNRQAPGQGTDQFTPILKALRAFDWQRPIAVEPFLYRPDGATTAARAIGYLRGIEEALS